jgi:hypothetical protein
MSGESRTACLCRRYHRGSGECPGSNRTVCLRKDLSRFRNVDATTGRQRKGSARASNGTGPARSVYPPPAPPFVNSILEYFESRRPDAGGYATWYRLRLDHSGELLVAFAQGTLLAATAQQHLETGAPKFPLKTTQLEKSNGTRCIQNIQGPRDEGGRP